MRDYELKQGRVRGKMFLAYKRTPTRCTVMGKKILLNENNE